MRPKSILTTADLKTGLNILWSQGLRRGDSTGWPTLDEHYTVAPGQLTVVTGWPGSGKSEFVDAMLLNLVQGDWRVAMFSPENRPTEVHVAKLLEKFVGKPFGRGPTERMTFEESQVAADVLSGVIGFIHPRESETPSVHDVLELAAEYFLSKTDTVGIKRGLVIDPWNELCHLRPSALTETEYVSQTLSTIRNWARDWDCHVWIVAHPAKQKREDGKLPVPRPDMIAGSQHWWNKADNCLTVVRDYENRDAPVDIHVQKIRFKHIGRIGLVSLRYDPVTGRYHEPKRDGNVIYSLAGAR